MRSWKATKVCHLPLQPTSKGREAWLLIRSLRKRKPSKRNSTSSTVAGCWSLKAMANLKLWSREASLPFQGRSSSRYRRNIQLSFQHFRSHLRKWGSTTTQRASTSQQQVTKCRKIMAKGTQRTQIQSRMRSTLNQGTCRMRTSASPGIKRALKLLNKMEETTQPGLTLPKNSVLKRRPKFKIKQRKTLCLVASIWKTRWYFSRCLPEGPWTKDRTKRLQFLC